MAHDAIAELYADTAWAADDTLVVDLPPGTGDVVLTTLQEVPVDGVVVVTTPFASSLADAARSVDLFREEGVPVLGVVRNMGEFTCPSCGDTHELFPDDGDGDGADPEDARPADDDGGLDAPTLADLPFSTDLQARPVPGDPLPGFGDLAGAVSDALDSAGTVDVPEDAVDLRGHPPDERRERVATAFEALDAGEELVLVSDRDPTPVRGFLADLADVHPAELDGFAVERRTPDDWVARATRP
jgi:ATP-binding protein involved in chromosome partitioning